MKIIKEVDKKELKTFLYDINIKDKLLYDELGNENSIGIFQLNGKTAASLNRDVKPKDFDETCAVLSLARPGPMEIAAPYFIERKNSNSSPYPEAVNDLLKQTHNTIVYQEQVMSIFNKIGGFSLEESNCLSGDTLIYTNMGKVSIKEIVDNKLELKVLTLNEKENTFEWKKIKDYFNNGKKKLIEIELEDGNILKCTPEHEIYTKNRGWVKAIELTENDELVHNNS